MTYEGGFSYMISENPKRIYLDTSHWINLVREYFELDHRVEYRNALDVMLKAVAAKRAIFPFGMVSVYETVATPDIQQRKRLAELMLKLSDNMVLVSPGQTQNREIGNAVYRFMGYPASQEEIQPFGKGVERAILSEEDIGKFRSIMLAQLATRIPVDQLFKRVDKALHSAKAGVELLVATDPVQRDETLRDLGSLADQICEALDTFRRNAKQPLNIAMFESYVEQFMDYYKPIMETILSKLGVPYNDLLAAGSARHRELLNDIPHVHIQMELSLARDVDLRRMVRRNDIPDILHLAMAMPYCDAVGADAAWRDLVHRTKLDKHYSCLVFSKLHEIIPMLSDAAS
jgi:hypothetical protein